MLNFAETRIDKIIIHRIGNHFAEEGIKLSDKCNKIDEATENILLHFFLKQFDGNVFYSFAPTEQPHVLKTYCSVVFSDASKFIDVSKIIANYLYDASTHPKIKSGDLYVAFLKDIVVDDELVDAIGIFKSESRDMFINVKYNPGDFANVELNTGINIGKIDKGILILNTEENSGYKIAVVDNVSKDTNYWKADFLNIEPRKNDFYNTKCFLTMCKRFAENEFADNVEKTEQIKFKQDAFDFMAKNDVFEMPEFEKAVLKTDELKQVFNEFKTEFEETYEVEFEQAFDISTEAVKKEKSKLHKSVVKLDKNFHVYVHGDTALMQRCYDEDKKMNYYKLYFNTEE